MVSEIKMKFCRHKKSFVCTACVAERLKVENKKVKGGNNGSQRGGLVHHVSAAAGLFPAVRLKEKKKKQLC